MSIRTDSWALRLLETIFLPIIRYLILTYFHCMFSLCTQAHILHHSTPWVDHKICYQHSECCMSCDIRFHNNQNCIYYTLHYHDHIFYFLHNSHCIFFYIDVRNIQDHSQHHRIHWYDHKRWISQHNDYGISRNICLHSIQNHNLHGISHWHDDRHFLAPHSVCCIRVSIQCRSCQRHILIGNKMSLLIVLIHIVIH